jgi:hypothetical protein
MIRCCLIMILTNDDMVSNNEMLCNDKMSWDVSNDEMLSNDGMLFKLRDAVKC